MLRLAFLLLALLAPASLPSSLVAEDGAPLRLKRVELLDRHGFAEPIPFATTLIPTDWTHDAQVLWGPCSDGGAFGLEVASPDRHHGLSFVPQIKWEQSERSRFMGCPQQHFADAESLLRALVVEADPSAEIVKSAPIEEVRRLDAERGMAPEIAAMVAASYDGVTARIRSTAPDGAALDTYAFAITEHMEGPGVRGGALRVMVFVTVPEGEDPEDVPALLLALDNLRLDQGWAERVARVRAQVSGMRIEAARKMAQDTLNTYREIARIDDETTRIVLGNQSAAYENRIVAADRTASRTVDAMTSTVTYEATGRDVTFPDAYETVWETTGGEFILSTDKAFDPNTLPGVEARELRQR